MKLMNFFLPEDLIEEVRRLSKVEGITMSTWVRDALWGAVEEKTGQSLPTIVKESYRRKRKA